MRSPHEPSEPFVDPAEEVRNVACVLYKVLVQTIVHIEFGNAELLRLFLEKPLQVVEHLSQTEVKVVSESLSRTRPRKDQHCQWARLVESEDVLVAHPGRDVSVHSRA